MSHRLSFQVGINLNMLKKSVFHSRNKIALKPSSLLRKEWLKNCNRKMNRCPHCFGVLLSKLLFQIHCILILQSRDQWMSQRVPLNHVWLQNFTNYQNSGYLTGQEEGNHCVFPSRNPRWATNTIIITFPKFTLDSKDSDGKFCYNQNSVKISIMTQSQKAYFSLSPRAKLHANKIWDICYSRMQERLFILLFVLSLLFKWYGSFSL